MATKFEYGQTPLEKQIVVQHQIIKQMEDPRNKGWFSNTDIDNARQQLGILNNEHYMLKNRSRFGGSKSKRHRRKTNMKCHKKSRKH